MAHLTETAFKELLDNTDLLAALGKKSFNHATPVQARTIPPARQQKDLLVKAATGSGKTLAFGLPLLSRLEAENAPRDKVFGLILTPTRELAVQIAEVLSGMLPGCEPPLIIGGMPYRTQRRQLEKDPRVVIGTPGRMLDFIDKKYLSLQSCQFFVLDEADEMFSMGFFEDVQRLLRKIPNTAQGLFVSATLSPRVVSLARSFLKDAEQIILEEGEEEAPKIEHLVCKVGGDVADKPNALCDLIEFYCPASAIIFCNTKSETELVEVFMRRRGLDARRINSDLNQRQRNRIMERIRAAELRFLVATDIAARGIDIEQIELVVNFSIHDQPETYIHRTGRTGRAGREGKAISLISPHDFMNYRALTREVDVEFQEIPLPSADELAASRLTILEDRLRAQKDETQDRDLALARQILSAYGDIETPSAELEEFLSRLCRFTTEHFVNERAQSLEEEISKESQGQENSQSRSKRQSSDGKGSHQSGRRNSGRQGRRNSKRRSR